MNRLGLTLLACVGISQTLLLAEATMERYWSPHSKYGDYPRAPKETIIRSADHQPIKLWIGAGPRDTDRVLAYVLQNIIRTNFRDFDAEIFNASYSYDQWVEAMACDNTSRPTCLTRPTLRSGLAQTEGRVVPSHGRVLTVGELGPRPRFAWFVTSRALQERIAMRPDHWFSFTNPNFTKHFMVLDEQLNVGTAIPGQPGKRWCSAPEFAGCDETGQYIPEWCKNQTCATVLAAFPQESYNALVKQITELRLFVKAAWIGGFLYGVVKSTSTNTVFFDYTLSELLYYIKNKKITEVLFPRCDATGPAGIGCINQSTKLLNLVTKDLKERAPQIHRLMTRVHLDDEDYDNLMTKAKNLFPLDDAGVLSIADDMSRVAWDRIRRWTRDDNNDRVSKRMCIHDMSVH